MLRKVMMDARVVTPGPLHGIGRYTYTLLTHIIHEIEKNPSIPLEFHILVTPDSPLNQLSWPNQFHLHTLRTPWLCLGRGLWELKKIISKYQPDVFHSPSFVVPFFSSGPRWVVTLHDMNHIALPQYYNLTHKLYYIFLKRWLKKVSCILTVSEFSKIEIHKYFEIPFEKIQVTQNGVGTNFTPTHTTAAFAAEKEQLQKKYQLPPQFALTFDNGKQHKNIALLENLYSQARCPWPLVIVGNCQKREHHGSICRVPYLPESDLPALYRHAQALIYPSLYEGFGLPPLEALASGIPVVASLSSALPEVLGSAAIYIDPTSPIDIIRGLREVAFAIEHDENKKQARTTAGLKQVEKFSWDKTAQKTLDVYLGLPLRGGRS